MEIDKKITFYCNNEKSEFRMLTINDVTASYIQGLRNQSQFLENRKSDISTTQQQEYIKNILSSDFDTICGLFVNSKLIGTSGIQDIRKDGSTTIGIFVFEEQLRGRGYGKTLIWCSCSLLSTCCRITKVAASVKKINIPSLKSFLSCGFEIVKENTDSYLLQLRCENLIQPNIINNVSFENSAN
jgi:RimJ/RimL family protein N-acetyltransferase